MLVEVLQYDKVMRYERHNNFGSKAIFGKTLFPTCVAELVVCIPLDEKLTTGLSVGRKKKSIFGALPVTPIGESTKLKNQSIWKNGPTLKREESCKITSNFVIVRGVIFIAIIADHSDRTLSYIYCPTKLTCTIPRGIDRVVIPTASEDVAALGTEVIASVEPVKNVFAVH